MEAWRLRFFRKGGLRGPHIQGRVESCNSLDSQALVPKHVKSSANGSCSHPPPPPRTESVKFSRALWKLVSDPEILSCLIGEHKPTLVIYKYRASDWMTYCQELVKPWFENLHDIKPKKPTNQTALSSSSGPNSVYCNSNTFFEECARLCLQLHPLHVIEKCVKLFLSSVRQEKLVSGITRLLL